MFNGGTSAPALTLHQDSTDPKPYPIAKRTSALDVVSTSSSSSNSNEEEAEGGGQGEGTDDAENNPVIRANPPNKTGRRPFLQIVVLFAADVRVMRYAKEVHTAFLENGVDAYLQTEETGQHILSSFPPSLPALPNPHSH